MSKLTPGPVQTNKIPLVEERVRRVRRRLWLTTLSRCVLTSLAAVLLVAAAYFLVRSIGWGPAGETEKWGILGGGVLLGLFAGLILSIVRSPGNLAAALAIDDTFHLKQRVTTYCSLTSEQRQTSAGQALLQDVEQKLGEIDLSGAFPLRIGWRQLALPAVALLLAVMSTVFSPGLPSLFSRGTDPNSFIVDSKTIAQQMENLKKVRYEKKDANLRDSKLKELEEAWDKLLKEDLDPKNEDQVRETIGKMQKLEDKLKTQINKLKDIKKSNNDLKKVLKELAEEQMRKKLHPDGPANDFQDALAKGDTSKAQKEIEKLRKKLKNKELTPEQQEQLANQFKEFRKQLERLQNNMKEREKLQKDFEDGKIDSEELQREMKRLNEEMKNLENLPNIDAAQLERLSNILGQCERCMGSGDTQGAMSKLDELRGELDAAIDDAEMQRLLDEMERLAEARENILGACQGECQGNGLGKGLRPGGKRPIGEDPKGTVKNARQPGTLNPNGQLRITGYTKGGVFRRVPASKIEGAFEQAVQEAPAALDRQRIPPDAADIAKDYFNKLGGQR